MAANIPPEALPIPFVLQLGNNVIQAGISEEDSLLQILHWIGFRNEGQRGNLVQDCFGSFEDLKVLNDKDVSAMASDFGGRTANNGRINFGTRRTKSIKATIHWVQDFYRVSERPTIVGLSELSFKAQLERALARAEIRKTLDGKSSTASKAADPGPLKNEKQWKEWEEKFVNYARCQLGANGIPLSYVIRENEDPDFDDNHPDFVSKTVACAPLIGEYYDADKLAVFNMVVSFTTGHPSGDWIKETLKYADGRRSMKALCAHFAGEGNASRNVAEADRLKESLHYKSERAMAFETFLTQMQRMFNIYEKEGEPIPEDQKVRLLFKKVEHKDLDSAIKALKARQIDGTQLTYTMAANHLSTAVSELPEYLVKNRNISGVGSSNSGGGKSGIYAADGSIKTGYISDWRSLSKEERSKVVAERKRLGVQGGRGGKGTSQSDIESDNTVKQLREQNKKYKRKIKALKRVSSKDDDEDDKDAESADEIDAGDQFGGRASKKNAKKHRN
jgi:hypothetical protein